MIMQASSNLLAFFLWGVYMLKRILSIILCLSIFLFSLCCYAPVSVKADASIYDIYKTIYEGYDFSSVISQHKSFNFTDKGGTKHPILYCVGGGWNYYFGRGGFIKDDVTLNYFLSWYACKGYNSDNKSVGTGLLSMINSKLGLVADISSSIVESVLLSRSDIEFEYDDDNGLTISSDSVDKLREEIKKQYYSLIGLKYYGSIGTPQERLQNVFSKYFKYQEDFVSNYNYLSDCKYFFYYSNDQYGWALTLNNSDNISYFYMGQGKYNMPLFAVDNELNVVDYSFTAMYSPFDNGYQNEDYKWGNLSMYNTFSYFTIPFTYESSYGTASGSNAFRFSSYNNKPFYYFKSYEALYNYVHGSQNAYLSSKVEQTGEDIKISIDDMNTNISDKMDELIDSINSKKDGMSADELQNAIDKGLESISGKMDDIKDNTEETNTKLDILLSAMQSQNEILMNILGVTTDIYNVVSSKDNEDDTNYTIADLQPHFNKCFTAVKNMVLYGESSFEDVGTQSVMNVDNDVGIAVYADDPENHVKDYHNGLLGKFPFCVPYQLYEWLQVLQADPKTPEFTYDYGYMLKYFGVSSDTDTVIKFDFSQYDDWAKNARSFLKLSFTLAVAVGTYRKFKGEI